MVTSSKLSQEAKAPGPSVVTVSGIANFFSWLQPLNAKLPMEVTALPGLTSMRPLHPLKA